MRRISLMYEKSGGCKPFTLCKDCRGFSVKAATAENDKRTDCAYYSRHFEDFPFWNGNWCACRFFEKKGTKAEPKHSAAKSAPVKPQKTEKEKTPKNPKAPKTSKIIESDGYVQLLLF